MPYEVIPKALLYATALFAVGLAVARRLLVAAAPDIQPDRFKYLEIRLHRLPLLAAILALVSLGVRAWAHTAASFGPAEAWSWEPLRVIVLESRWGGAWQRQVLAAVALALAAAALARWRRAGWVVYTAGAVIVCATLPLLGHGAGSVWRTALHAGHLLGAGAWLGTLAAIVAVGLGAPRAPLAGSKGRSDLLPVLQRFSNVALTGAGVAAATGALLAAVYVLSPINLTATGYGPDAAREARWRRRHRLVRPPQLAAHATRRHAVARADRGRAGPCGGCRRRDERADGARTAVGSPVR